MAIPIQTATLAIVPMKIYTKTGDDGSTGLIGGSRVSKSDPRIDCYGTVDELNASLGLAAVTIDASSRPNLLAVQNDLFVIGSHLAAPDGRIPENSNWPTLDEAMITRLEMQIDTAESMLPYLRQFILPGGCETAARLHLARTICRRAERLLVDYSLDRPVPMIVLTYLNRLSDWLFVHARLSNQLAGIPDVPWVK
jgi:cob(I)alamin adenosyltransferase